MFNKPDRRLIIEYLSSWRISQSWNYQRCSLTWRSSTARASLENDCNSLPIKVGSNKFLPFPWGTKMAQATKKRTAGSFRISAAISFWLCIKRCPIQPACMNLFASCHTEWFTTQKKNYWHTSIFMPEYTHTCPNKCQGSFKRTVISLKTLFLISSIDGVADFLNTV